MTISYSIRIVDEDGNGVEGANVYIEYGGLLGSWDEGYTDENGWVEFDTSQDIISKVYVNDEIVGEDYRVEEGDTFSFTES
jgi:hypothetical protein